MTYEKTTDKNIIDKIIAYESGDMDTKAEIIDFFQYLVDNGLAWKLRGMYGRQARALIKAGLINV